MTICYQWRFVEGSLFLRGQIVRRQVEDAEPTWATTDRLRRIAAHRNVVKVWIEI